jgi:hypothetical protein
MVNATFSTGLEIGVELQLSTAQARRQKKLQHPTRSVENVALTTKGLQMTMEK